MTVMVVLRPIQGADRVFLPGEVVDTSGWRNAAALTAQRRLGPTDAVGVAPDPTPTAPSPAPAPAVEAVAPAAPAAKKAPAKRAARRT